MASLKTPLLGAAMDPEADAKPGPPKPPATGLLVVAAAFLYVDLASAFVHAFFDNCSPAHPLLGQMCRGTQYHHHHPRPPRRIPICAPVPWAALPPVTGLHTHFTRTPVAGGSRSGRSHHTARPRVSVGNRAEPCIDTSGGRGAGSRE